MIRNRQTISISVAVFRLDDIVLAVGLPAPTRLKIGVDGAELEILRGSLNSPKSVNELVVEYKPESKNLELIHDLLIGCGFEFDFNSEAEHLEGWVDGFFREKIEQS